MDFFTLAKDAASNAVSSGSTGYGAGGGGWLEMLLPMGGMIVMFVVLYFFMIRPQKKKQKEEAKMRDNLQPGDEIMTIGGFYGKVISVKEDTVIIESVVDRAKQKITRSAIQTNFTVHDDTDDK